MFEAITIQRMERPVDSPILIRIEHDWDMLERCIHARPKPHFTVRELEIAFLEERSSIPSSHIKKIAKHLNNIVLS